MKTTTLAILAAVTATPTLAEPVQTEAALLSALGDHACMLAPEEVAEYLGPLGFSPDFVRQTLSGWMVDGTASEDHLRRLSLPVPLCPPETRAPTPKDALLGEFSARDCTLDQADMAGIGRDLGLSDAQIIAVVTPLYEAGEIEISGSQATLSASLCDAQTE